MAFGRTPIAWLQLRYQKGQTFAAACGITFITVLLFMQIGFRATFLETLVDLPASLKGDLFMLNASVVTILTPPTFSQRRLYQVLAFDEVESITPIYWTMTSMRDPAGGARFRRKIQVLGFPVSKNPIDIPGVDENFAKLKRRKVFLIDERSREEFQPVVTAVNESNKKDIEIQGGARKTRISIEGLFSLGVNTTADSHLLTSDATFMDVFDRPRQRINVGLIKLRAGVDHDAVVRKLEAFLPPDVIVATKEARLEDERKYYEFGTPIGLIFRFGLGGAVVVGIVVLYQILFQIVSKYLRDYATLKAIGYSANMLKLTVVKVALILAVLGYLPGLGLTLYMYHVLTGATGLTFNMTPTVAIAVLGAVCFICLISAMLAIRKLRDADPADLFG